MFTVLISLKTPGRRDQIIKTVSVKTVPLLIKLPAQNSKMMLKCD